MKYRIIRRPKDEMYYIQTWDEKTYSGTYIEDSPLNQPVWKDYDGDLGEPDPDHPILYDYYRRGFFSLHSAKRALKKLKDQAKREDAPDEVVWEDDD